MTLTATDVGALPSAGGSMTGVINMNGQSISGLNNPTEESQAARKGYVDASVRKAAPRNLLDNSDFTNLVAQAGIGGNHGTMAYAADRWILDSGTVSYSAGTGLTLNGTITQKLENALAAAYPYVGMVSGTASISYTNGTVTITSSGGVIQWAALYANEYTADTLPEYKPKGYGVELLECMRYYQKFTDVEVNSIAFVRGNGARFVWPFMVKMRTKPTLTFGDDFIGAGVVSYWTNASVGYVSSANITDTDQSTDQHLAFIVSETMPKDTAVRAMFSCVADANL